MPLFGKDLSFYHLLEQQAQAAHDAAKIFFELSGDWSRLEEYAAAIDDIEHNADDITHRLARKSNATFVTPLDKEDLRALSSALDDITDAIEAAVSRIIIYRLTTMRNDVPPIVAQLVEITHLTHDAVAALPRVSDSEEMRQRFIRIHEVENDSDRLFRQALQDLFDTPNPDPLMVVKWKEIYDRIEIAVDKCEDVANVVEGVVQKYA
ncbi:MAG TPA: DUF47 family protein [Armatimonadota bacterium]|nr:DUF47 family protein [Armatimonadota bacterium]